MADISSVSVSQSLDTLASQYQATLVAQTVTPMTTAQNSLTTRLNALNTLKTKLQALNDAMSALSASGDTSSFQSFSVDSTDASVASASATATATPGTHTLQVSQLAKNDLVLSSRLSSASTSLADSLGAGTQTIRLSINHVDTDVNVTIAAGASNATVLNSIAAAIRASGAKVTASVINDTSSTSRLVLNSTDSGADASIALSDQSGSLFDALGLGAGVVSGRSVSTATAGGFVYGDTANLNAIFKFDGIDMIRQSNTISDVVGGVTFTLKGTQDASEAPVALSVGVDSTKVTAGIQNFMTKYNDVISFLQTTSAIDVKNNTRGVFAYDSTFRMLRSDLRIMASQQISSSGAGNPSMLSELGISADSNGLLSMSDPSKLQDALDANPAGVSSLFNSSNGLGVQLKAKLGMFISLNGAVASETSSVTAQINTYNDRITRASVKITNQVAAYRQQYAELQALLAQAVSQQNIVASLMGSSLANWSG